MKKFLLGVCLISAVSWQANASNYVFGWTHLQDSKMHEVRGGTTKGTEVSLEQSPSEHWRKLHETNLTKLEKDRLAILAMQGQYRVYFDFMETMGFVEGYSPPRPYQSWGTEFVVVVDQEDDFISLQHIMVIYFEPEKGSEPVMHVMKHWRQDWHYQDPEIHSFIGDNTWSRVKVPLRDREGNWSQSVYHVDDSPRYQGYGAWTHSSDYSSWTSNETWRPIPRRESSVRNDYDAIVGINIQTITPDGWVHEQNNRKVASGEKPIVRAKEIGLARYQRIVDFDWSPGVEFWQDTTQFWRVVRDTWDRKLTTSNNLKILQEVDGAFLFMRLFDLASRYGQGDGKALGEIGDIIDTHSKVVRISVP